ncbi:ABC transporter permease [Fontivita pretiosa]|uniref:ABC transporter permease n=1 Tax=Fontivita pretiosa TaxID=2989684 RepID=UPI003D17071D
MSILENTSSTASPAQPDLTEAAALPAHSAPTAQSEPPLTIIRPRSGWQAVELREVWRYRDLLWLLALREIQVRYKQTILGVLWVIIQPLATSGIFAALLGMLMGRGNEPGVAGVPYFVSTFCAMLPWQLFASSLSQAGNSLIANQRLITKVYFPRLIVPMSAVLAALADFAVGLLALAAVMILYGLWPPVQILLLPLLTAVAVLASLAAGLWLSALSALYRDFRHVIPFLVQLGLVVSPVIYTTQKIQPKLPEWAMMLYALNPMVGVIEGFRWALLPQAEPPLLVCGLSILSTALLLISGAFFFRRMERSFADLV